MSSPDPIVVGWDIGGAHVKASVVRDGRIADTAQWPAPIWQGMMHLDSAIEAAGRRWTSIEPTHHVVTMTAEMTDLFEDREAGVGALVAHLAHALAPTPLFYAGEAGWLTADAAVRAWRDVASANWLATAHCAAATAADGLLIDIGSTTTDLIPIRHGRPCPSGRSDADRLASGELVYLGVVRTPLCALAERIRWQGREFNVMNEWFATTGDVFRLLARLDPDHDQYPPADGGHKDEPGTCRRLARMIGHDGHDADASAWRALAAEWAARMSTRIADNVQRICAAAALPADAPIIGAGCGSFLAGDLAMQLGRPFIPFHRHVLAPAGLEAWVSTCAPSAAIASLYAAGVRPCG
ncbi:MAG: H4MPT-linked C1 transfer pathway protein [Rhodocyclaceae bacterium]|nr:H4MPT-linked C1 transfer pathway protein [Rhodocyclaceae bacterium]